MTQVSGIFILVFAGRLLGPAILGSFVLVSAVVELLRMVARAGWRDYLLSETGRANDVQISALCALLFASIAAIVGLLGSVIMRIVISDPVYANLLAVLSILVPFEAVSFVMDSECPDTMHRRGNRSNTRLMGAVFRVWFVCFGACEGCILDHCVCWAVAGYQTFDYASGR